jgi:hypothetical protein
MEEASGKFIRDVLPSTFASVFRERETRRLLDDAEILSALNEIADLRSKLAAAEGVVSAARTLLETMSGVKMQLWSQDKQLTFGETMGAKFVEIKLAALDAAGRVTPPPGT